MELFHLSVEIFHLSKRFCFKIWLGKCKLFIFLRINLVEGELLENADLILLNKIKSSKWIFVEWISYKGAQRIFLKFRKNNRPPPSLSLFVDPTQLKLCSLTQWNYIVLNSYILQLMTWVAFIWWLHNYLASADWMLAIFITRQTDNRDTQYLMIFHQKTIYSYSINRLCLI